MTILAPSSASVNPPRGFILRADNPPPRLSFGPDDPPPVAFTEKHRPRTLADIVGQGWAALQLRTFLDAPYSCAFIFDGPTGVGKTSAALALAAELGSVQFGGLHIIDSGMQDAEAVADVLDSLRFTPMLGSGWKVVIVEEADHASPKARQLWLSALESLPPHSIIVFTTNSADKFEPRFMDRCERIRFASDAATLIADAQMLIDRVWTAETGQSDSPRVSSIPGLVATDGTLSFRRAVSALVPMVRMLRSGAATCNQAAPAEAAPAPAKKPRKPRAKKFKALPAPDPIPTAEEVGAAEADAHLIAWDDDAPVVAPAPPARDIEIDNAIDCALFTARISGMPWAVIFTPGLEYPYGLVAVRTLEQAPIRLAQRVRYVADPPRVDAPDTDPDPPPSLTPTGRQVKIRGKEYLAHPWPMPGGLRAWSVFRGESEYIVAEGTDGRPTCECADWRMRCANIPAHAHCKHIITLIELGMISESFPDPDPTPDPEPEHRPMIEDMTADEILAKLKAATPELFGRTRKAPAPRARAEAPEPPAPAYRRGDPVEVERLTGAWEPGTVTDEHSYPDEGESFLRVNIEMKDGLVILGAHPDCVRPAPPARDSERSSVASELRRLRNAMPDRDGRSDVNRDHLLPMRRDRAERREYNRILTASERRDIAANAYRNRVAAEEAESSARMIAEDNRIMAQMLFAPKVDGWGRNHSPTGLRDARGNDPSNEDGS